MFGILLFFVLYMDTSAYSFQEEPEDTNAIVGMTVTLRCIIKNRNSMDVLWYDQGNNRYVSKNREVYQYTDDSSRFLITGDAHIGEYFLRIANVTAEDAGLYGCFLFEDREFRVSSRNALLQVFPEPDNTFPVCSIIPDVTSGGTGPGDWIVLKCIADGGSPFSRLDWVRSFEILPGAFLDENEPKAVYQFRLTEYHNGAVFSCVENNPVLPHTRSCSVMPFYHPTNVTLKLQPLRPIIANDVIVTCDVEALPMFGINYTWYLNGEDISSTFGDDRFSLTEDKRQLIFHEVNATFNNSVIECNVINLIELEGKASIILKLKEEQMLAKVIPETESDSKNIALALILGITIPCVLCILLVFIVVLYRRKRIGFMNVLKTRKSDLRFSRYAEKQRFMRTSETTDLPEDVDESFQSVIICSTPRDAIQEHLKEVKRSNSVLERGSKKVDSKHHQELSEMCRLPEARGRSRPTISAPISVFIPDLKVPLRDLNIKHGDTSSVDEDYVSDDADTDWDL